MEKTTMRRRAIGNEQKEERRLAILETAWQMFQACSYEELTIAGVAQAAGLAKGTVFLYFNTKESLFLGILEQQLTDWFGEVDARLEKLPSPSEILPVAEVISRTLETRPALVRLLAILHTVLERNIALEEAVSFKLFLQTHFIRTGQLLERCLSFLTPSSGAHLLLQSYALVIGIWHLTDNAPIIQQALQRPDLEMFKVHFDREFPLALQALWYGLERTT
jgi:AcrR family transcriptional regulator